MKIVAKYDGSGPKYHRIMFPCSALYHDYGIETKMVNLFIEQDFEGTDIVFFNRLTNIHPLEMLKFREKYGFKLICDLDDHWVLDKGHNLHNDYKEHNVSENIAWHVKYSDAVFVTHERLAKEVLPLNKNVYILPNAIPKHDQFIINKTYDEKTRLFWAGSSTHKRDLKLIQRPLQLIKKENVKLIICGYVKEDPEWKEMAKIYTNNSSYNTVVINALPVEKYYSAYCLCDISLVPLVDVSFNWYKSNLKVLEAANAGSPVIVSRVHPYLGFPEDIVNYVDAHNPWYFQINRLLNDKELVKDQGQRLREYCDLHYNFNRINENRRQILEYEAGKR